MSKCPYCYHKNTYYSKDVVTDRKSTLFGGREDIYIICKNCGKNVSLSSQYIDNSGNPRTPRKFSRWD